MNQVQVKEEAGALATNLFEADANAGSQNMTQEDLALPFLKVLGQLSPEVNKQNACYDEQQGDKNIDRDRLIQNKTPQHNP